MSVAFLLFGLPPSWGQLGSGDDPRSPGGSADLVVVVGDFDVQVSGLEPFHSAFLLGVAQKTIGGLPYSFEVSEVVEDDDGDGVARWQSEELIPPVLSSWLAIDIESGEHVWPDKGRRGEFPAVDLVFGDGLTDGQIRIAGPSARMLLIRPGLAVWRGEFRDGAVVDQDTQVNGQVEFPVRELLVVEGPDFYQANSFLMPGDLLASVDLDQVAVSARVLTEADDQNPNTKEN